MAEAICFIEKVLQSMRDKLHTTRHEKSYSNSQYMNDNTRDRRIVKYNSEYPSEQYNTTRRTYRRRSASRGYRKRSTSREYRKRSTSREYRKRSMSREYRKRSVSRGYREQSKASDDKSIKKNYQSTNINKSKVNDDAKIREKNLELKNHQHINYTKNERNEDEKNGKNKTDDKDEQDFIPITDQKLKKKPTIKISSNKKPSSELNFDKNTKDVKETKKDQSTELEEGELIENNGRYFQSYIDKSGDTKIRDNICENNANCMIQNCRYIHFMPSNICRNEKCSDIKCMNYHLIDDITGTHFQKCANIYNCDNIKCTGAHSDLELKITINKRQKIIGYMMQKECTNTYCNRYCMYSKAHGSYYDKYRDVVDDFIDKNKRAYCNDGPTCRSDICLFQMHLNPSVLCSTNFRQSCFGSRCGYYHLIEDITGTRFDLCHIQNCSKNYCKEPHTIHELQDIIKKRRKDIATVMNKKCNEIKCSYYCLKSMAHGSYYDKYRHLMNGLIDEFPNL